MRKRLLVWDTSSRTGTIAALEWNTMEREKGRFALKLVAEWTLSLEAVHAERLLWSIDKILASCGWTLADVDYFGVGLGPGSFTGLRIGLTTARTLAQTTGKPLVGVSSLAALARPVAAWLIEKKESATLVAATDAAKGEWFTLWGSARSIADCSVHPEEGAPLESTGTWKRGVVEEVVRPTELFKKLKRKIGTTGKWAVFGEAADRYPELWEELPASRRLELPLPFLSQVQGRYVGLLAWEAIQAGQIRDPLSVSPRYLRSPDATIKLQAGLLPPGPTRGGSAPPR